MAKISFTPTFLKEVLMVFRERPLKEIIFGKKVQHSADEKQTLNWIKNNPQEFKARGGRRGSFITINLAHRGKGTVYLLPSIAGNSSNQSQLLFAEDVKVIPGPDLYVYLSTAADARQNLGEYINLGLLQGTKGGQSYLINQPIEQLDKYQSAVIYCKQFAVLFTFAQLT